MWRFNRRNGPGFRLGGRTNEDYVSASLFTPPSALPRQRRYSDVATDGRLSMITKAWA